MLKFLSADNIEGLSAALASTHPDSTIRVRAAYDSIKTKKVRLKRMNPALRFINQLGGYADLKNCFYYFAGNASQINSGQSFGNYDDIEKICTLTAFAISFPTAVISFLSDTHVSVFLSLYKSSKNLENYPLIYIRYNLCWCFG